MKENLIYKLHLAEEAVKQAKRELKEKQSQDLFNARQLLYKKDIAKQTISRLLPSEHTNSSKLKSSKYPFGVVAKENETLERGCIGGTIRTFYKFNTTNNYFIKPVKERETVTRVRKIKHVQSIVLNGVKYTIVKHSHLEK